MSEQLMLWVHGLAPTPSLCIYSWGWVVLDGSRNPCSSSIVARNAQLCTHVCSCGFVVSICFSVCLITAVNNVICLMQIHLNHSKILVTHKYITVNLCWCYFQYYFQYVMICGRWMIVCAKSGMFSKTDNFCCLRLDVLLVKN